LRNLGQGLGVAFGGAIIAVRQSYYLSRAAAGMGGPEMASRAAYLMSQRDAFLFGLCVVAAAIFCMARIPRGKAT
jgi:hypothetical protein